MTDWHIHTGDCIEVLRDMPAESVHCVITSPPYYGLRDYGTAQWEGGDSACSHEPPQEWIDHNFNANGVLGNGHKGQSAAAKGRWYNADGSCPACGARRIDGQIGLEQSPAEFVAKMVEVFAEVRRVLRSDGTCWVNLGDSYCGYKGENYGVRPESSRLQSKSAIATAHNVGTPQTSGLKPKDLMLMPARVALALQEAGWWVRSDIIWAKRAPMPESVTDRPTSAHEHVFLLSKAANYYYDADAVREPLAESTVRIHSSENVQARPGDWKVGHVGNGHSGLQNGIVRSGRNMWNYWLLSPEPYAAAHFATFPTEIPRRAILAGTSEHGVCGECGAPWKRVVEITRVDGGPKWRPTPKNRAALGDLSDKSVFNTGLRTEHTTTGWQPTCRHTDAPVVPATVLDPFSGAGTTVMQALRLGRRGIGIELNPAYVEMSKRRIIEDAPLWNTPMEAIA